MKNYLVHFNCTRLVFRIYNQVILFSLLLWPVLLSYLLYPDTFVFSWNEGRGGFLIATVLLLVEILGSRPVIRGPKTGLLIALGILISLYFLSLPFGSSNILTSIGRLAGVLISESWMSMWDYTILAMYFLITLVLIFGKKEWITIGGAATLFLIGYATILLLDSLFPYDTLGIIQFLVPIYLNVNVGILETINHILNLETEFNSQTFGNTLVLNSPYGPFVMKVYWPSAGVHSIIIFSFVLFAFLLKSSIPWTRIFIYLVLGMFLTGVVNIMRIMILSLYAIDPNSDLQSWEQFHSVIGEIIFIPWVLLYLVFVIFIEKWCHRAKAKTSACDNICSAKER
jgi:thaumarchaeosortase